MSLDVAIRHAAGQFWLDVAFVAPAGVTALFGPSGAGKSTVVNAIAGLVRPSAGRISVDGEVLFDAVAGINVAVHKRRVGYVFQDSRLFPHLSVRQNLAYGRWFSRSAIDGDAFDRIVELLAIGDLLARRPGGLSGGERQRVAIGRALLAQPRILLFDEPLAALDADRKAEILPYLERLRDSSAIPIVYVSHAIAEVARLATTVVVINNGVVVSQGLPVDVFSHTVAAPGVADSDIGAILTARVVAHDQLDRLTELAFDGGRLFVPLLNDPAGTAVRVRIKASDVLLALREPEDSSALNILAGDVVEVGPAIDGRVNVAIRCGAARLMARITWRSLDRLDLQRGMRVYAVIKSVAMAHEDIGHFGGG